MTQETSKPIRVLLVEDTESDAELTLRHLARAGLQCTSRRVETETDLHDAFRNFAPDIVLSDFSLPQLNGLTALKVTRETVPDVPFIYVSGTIGEERAVHRATQWCC